MTDVFKASHWSKLTSDELEEWGRLAPNFTPKELASNGDGSILIVKEALEALQKLRNLYARPIVINSAYRDPAYNRKVGGVSDSQHTLGIAFDLGISDKETGATLERIAKEVGFTAIGRYSNFIHVDKRPAKKDGKLYLWGKAYV